MRQLTYVSPHVLEWHDVPAPTLQEPGDALVRPIAVATCDLDSGIVAGAMTADARTEASAGDSFSES